MLLGPLLRTGLPRIAAGPSPKSECTALDREMPAARRKDYECSPQAPPRHVPAADAAASAKLTPLLVMAAVVSAISALLYGYDTGIISGACSRSRVSSTPDRVEQIIASSILLARSSGRYRAVGSPSGGAGTGRCCLSRLFSSSGRWPVRYRHDLGAVAEPGRARLRGRRRDPDHPDVRAELARQAPRAAGPDLPGRYRVGIVVSTIIGASQHFCLAVSSRWPQGRRR